MDGWEIESDSSTTDWKMEVLVKERLMTLVEQKKTPGVKNKHSLKSSMAANF